ncbi:hypothetical protein Cgig2_006267 [Carnegiea gigantea]|uniref:Uncharacterized protein n=1 Tax=Carnegiea gigantea TaxID=171969 RepID=A0A9Q1QAN5_9CARY|nr:hypothetical protein Cgig2_006267 [Carnegiea gigantea]
MLSNVLVRASTIIGYNEGPHKRPLRDLLTKKMLNTLEKFNKTAKQITVVRMPLGGRQPHILNTLQKTPSHDSPKGLTDEVLRAELGPNSLNTTCPSMAYINNDLIGGSLKSDDYPITGFTGHPIKPKGLIRLLVLIREGESSRHPEADFLVVDRCKLGLQCINRETLIYQICNSPILNHIYLFKSCLFV